MADLKATIVLAEDNEPVRRMAQMLLTRKGFEVHEHPDGAAAWAEVDQTPPDLVISDIQMPKMDGLELTRKVREKFDKRTLPVILISALSEEEDIVSGFEAGANDYLVKPYKNAELLAKVQVLLKERKFLRQDNEPLPPPTPERPHVPGDEDTTTVRAPTEVPASPTYYFDKYLVKGEFGRGGMGTVYRAVRREDELEVALKILAPRLSGNKTAVARFLREIRTLQGLSSENVVQVLDHGYDAGRYFLVMEAVEGDSLDRVVLRDGPLSETEAARVFWQVGDALQALTDQGLVHRDIKPANIIRRNADGQVKLVDFGLAKHEQEASALTETGYALGTSYYVAPEVIEGAKSDMRSDLFAVGVSLFEVLTGRRPFPGVVPYQIFKRIVSGPTPDPREFRANLAQGLVDVLAKLLEKDPASRYQSGKDLADALRAWAESDEGKAAAERDG
jgi:CheY-like chemotaxis protein